MKGYSFPGCGNLLMIVVQPGLGSRVLKTAKKNGISGGTILLGRGTVQTNLPELLALRETRKEIVLILGNKIEINQGLEILDHTFHFEKPHHGIGLVFSLSSLWGTSHCGTEQYELKTKQSESQEMDFEQAKNQGDKKMYKAIFVVVEKGNAEIVIDAATKVGAKGGTIINARGSGVHEKQKFFAMEIEPEKEVVLIVTEIAKVDEIYQAICEEIPLEEPGNGVMFVLDVDQARGLA